MAKQERWSKEQSAQFFDAVATLGAGAKVFADGVQYVDDVGFWRWFTEGPVQAPVVDGVPLPLTDAESIRRWASSFTDTNRARGFETLLRGRGAEYDFVRSHQHDPIEFLKGHLWRHASAAEDRLGVDAVRESIFGPDETHQLKMGLSEQGSSVNLRRYMPSGSQPVDVVDVNEGIAKWRESENGRQAIVAREDAHPNVQTSVSDNELRVAGQRRVDEAQRGHATPKVTFEGAATQVGRGALIGAVVSVGVSTAVNFGRYRRGEIDGATFGNLMLEDSARGALTGGSIAAVNIPVQLAAQALGLGNPVTIPVMIVVGAGIRYVIDPMFGRGAYADQLRELEITTDVATGIARFAGRCHASFEAQRPFIEKMAKLQGRARVLNELSSVSDGLLDEAIDNI